MKVTAPSFILIRIIRSLPIWILSMWIFIRIGKASPRPLPSSSIARIATGCLIVCGEDKKLLELVRQAKVKAVTYGMSDEHDVYATDIMTDGFQSSFPAIPKKGKLGDFELNVPGRHNILNALACISLGLQLGIPYEVMFKTLKNFTGVKRRFQLKGRVNDVMVIDDYGHHPTEITATLNAARLFGPKRLITVFQPHRYSRTKFLLNEFVEHLSLQR